MITEDSTPVTVASSFFQTALRESLLLHNQSQADLIVQGLQAATFWPKILGSGERLVVSLADKHITHTLLEMMLVVAMTTLAYLVAKTDS